MRETPFLLILHYVSVRLQANVLFDFDLGDNSLYDLHAVVETNNLINTLAQCSSKRSLTNI